MDLAFAIESAIRVLSLLGRLASVFAAVHSAFPRPATLERRVNLVFMPSHIEVWGWGV